MSQPGFDSAHPYYAGAPTPYPGAPIPPRPAHRPWLAASVSPLVAFVVVYLVALLWTFVASPVGDTSTELSDLGMDLSDITLSPFVSSLQIVLMSLGASYGGRIILSGDLSSLESITGTPIDGSEFAVNFSLRMVPILVTAIFAVIIFIWHRLDAAKAPAAPAKHVVPALVSGAVLAVLGGITALFARVDILNLMEKAGMDPRDYGLDLKLDFSFFLVPWQAALGGFVIAFVAAWTARVASVKLKDRAAKGMRPDALVPTVVHATKIAFAFFVIATTVIGVYLLIYALTQLDSSLAAEGVPADIGLEGQKFQLFLALLPYVPLIGSVGLIGPLGGFGTAGYNAPAWLTGGSSGEFIRSQFLEGAPFGFIASVFFAIAVIVLIALWWGRTQAPGTGRSFISWLYLPVTFLLMGTVWIAATTLSGRLRLETDALLPEYSSGLTVGFGVYARLSWLTLIWFVGMGIIIELLSRPFRTHGAPLPVAYDPYAPYEYGALPQFGGQPFPPQAYGSPVPHDPYAQPGGQYTPPTAQYAPPAPAGAPYTPAPAATQPYETPESPRPADHTEADHTE